MQPLQVHRPPQTVRAFNFCSALQKLAGASLLVFANKQDLPGALSAEEIAEANRDPRMPQPMCAHGRVLDREDAAYRPRYSICCARLQFLELASLSNRHTRIQWCSAGTQASVGLDCWPESDSGWSSVRTADWLRAERQ